MTTSQLRISLQQRDNLLSLQVMEILRQSLPLELRPYSFLGWKTLDSAREITTLAFRGLKDVLVSGSIDCHVSTTSLDLFYRWQCSILRWVNNPGRFTYGMLSALP